MGTGQHTTSSGQGQDVAPRGLTKNITRGRVARALGLPMQELEGLIFGLALVGVDGGAAGAPETGVPEPHQRGHLRLVE